MFRARATIVIVVLVSVVVPSAPTYGAADLECKGRKVTLPAKEMTEGDDLIVGTKGDDVINGRGGSDEINGRGGDDTICGGPGRDTVIFTTKSVVADLTEGIAATDEGTSKLIDIEDLIGTAGDDKLIGNSGQNSLEGLRGNDELRGKGGVDFLDGGPDDDLLDPGTDHDDVHAGTSGIDTLSYKSAQGAVLVGIADGRLRAFEYQGETTKTKVDTADSLQGTFEEIEGSQYHDELSALVVATVLFGLGGDDVLAGGKGDDLIFGGKGDDRLIGGAGSDGLNGGSNTDVKNAEARGDVVDYTNADAPDGVEVDLALGVATGDGDDRLTGIESATAANAGPSILTGNDGPNVLEGLRWYDELYGNGGSDVLIGGRELDILVGGPGADYLDGGIDDDELNPGEGDDVIVGGEGPLTCDGDCSADYLLYAEAPGPVTVDLEKGTASTGAWGTDTFVEVEAVIGSAFDDVLKGSFESNVLQGGDGNDSLEGLGGNDGLYGDGGFDTADGGSGTDFCDTESRVNCEGPNVRAPFFRSRHGQVIAMWRVLSFWTNPFPH
jgi:Ca2+-binding RTX toxin-like protein